MHGTVFWSCCWYSVAQESKTKSEIKRVYLVLTAADVSSWGSMNGTWQRVIHMCCCKNITWWQNYVWILLLLLLKSLYIFYLLVLTAEHQLKDLITDVSLEIQIDQCYENASCGCMPLGIAGPLLAISGILMHLLQSAVLIEFLKIHRSQSWRGIPLNGSPCLF